MGKIETNMKSIKLIKINGENSNIDYDLLKESFVNPKIIDQSESTFKCSEAKIFVLNNIPLINGYDIKIYEGFIDFLLIVALPWNLSGSYISIHKKHTTQYIYLNNLIIPVKFISNSNEKNKFDFDKKSEFTKVNHNQSLKNYFKIIFYKCGLNYNVNVHPLIFIKNNDFTIDGNIIKNKTFDFNIIFKWLELNDLNEYDSYKRWKLNYEQIDDDILKIYEQAKKGV